MIVKCDNSWKERIEEFIGNDYPACLYLYLDFKKYGFEVDYVTIWVQIDKDEHINCVILKYHTGMHIYSKILNFEVDEVIKLIKEESPDMICGRGDIIKFLAQEEEMTGYESEFGYIGQCEHVESFPPRYSTEKAEKSDFPQIVQLLYYDEGIGASYDLEELGNQMYERNSQGFVRNYIIRKQGEPVCHVCTGAEFGNIAIVSGVVTDLAVRGKGYASSLLSYICKELLEEGKDVYTVYYTNEARNLHHKVGFIDYCAFGKLFRRHH